MPVMNSPYETLLSAGTAMIADVFDALGHTPPVLDNSLCPVGLPRRFAGPAYTITGKSTKYVGGDRAKLEAIDQMPSGVVSMWAGEDAKGLCCFGDLLASAMQMRGCAAAVVDGGVRDVTHLAALEMPVVSRYKTPAQGVGRWRVASAQVPVRMRGALARWVVVAPGDVVVGDEDGVIVTPVRLVADVTARLTELATSDSAARNDILKGLPLLEALAKYGHL